MSSHGTRELGIVSALVIVGLVSIAYSPKDALLVAATLVAIAIVVQIPVHQIPTLALSVFILAAIPRIPFQSQSGSINIELVLILYWAARRLMQTPVADLPKRRLVAAMAAILCGWLAIGTLLSINKVTSILWCADVILLVVLPAVLFNRREAAACLTAWWRIGNVLAAYTILETVLRSNPIWGSSLIGVVSPVSGPFRASASFQTAIYAGLFFAVTTVFAIARALRAPLGRRQTSYAAVLLQVVAVILTGTRGGAVGVAVGAAVLLVAFFLQQFRSGRGAQAILRLAAVALLCGCLFAAVYSYRGDATGSTSVHARSEATALVIIRNQPSYGYGPGTAYSVKTSTPGPGTDEQRSVEDAWLELIIATGYPGVLIFAGLLLVAFVRGIRLGALAAAAGIAAYAVEGGTFNVLEGQRPGLILLGVLIGAAAAGADFALPGGGSDRREPGRGAHRHAVAASGF